MGLLRPKVAVAVAVVDGADGGICLHGASLRLGLLLWGGVVRGVSRAACGGW